MYTLSMVCVGYVKHMYVVDKIWGNRGDGGSSRRKSLRKTLTYQKTRGPVVVVLLFKIQRKRLASSFAHFQITNLLYSGALLQRDFLVIVKSACVCVCVKSY